MDHEPDVVRQIAHVYVDLMSIGEAPLSRTELADALDLASQRAIELGALVIEQDGETVTIDPTNLVAGALRAMHALTRVVEPHTPLSPEALLAAWREGIDDKEEPA
jgi:hypothetical protein